MKFTAKTRLDLYHCIPKVGLTELDDMQVSIAGARETCTAGLKEGNHGERNSV